MEEERREEDEEEREKRTKRKKEKRMKKTCTLVYNLLLKCSHAEKSFSNYSRNAPINSVNCRYFVVLWPEFERINKIC